MKIEFSKKYEINYPSRTSPVQDWLPQPNPTSP